MRFTILAFCSVSDTVCENCLQTIEVCAKNVRSFVDCHACKELAHALAHDARLAMMNGEPFLQQNCSGVDCKALYAALKFSIARKCQVICISRVSASSGLR